MATTNYWNFARVSYCLLRVVVRVRLFVVSCIKEQVMIEIPRASHDWLFNLENMHYAWPDTSRQALRKIVHVLRASAVLFSREQWFDFRAKIIGRHKTSAFCIKKCYHNISRHTNLFKPNILTQCNLHLSLKLISYSDHRGHALHQFHQFWRPPNSMLCVLTSLLKLTLAWPHANWSRFP